MISWKFHFAMTLCHVKSIVWLFWWTFFWMDEKMILMDEILHYISTLIIITYTLPTYYLPTYPLIITYTLRTCCTHHTYTLLTIVTYTYILHIYPPRYLQIINIHN
jgi:hypothetical protein